jgi:hypothetical protein
MNEKSAVRVNVEMDAEVHKKLKHWSIEHDTTIKAIFSEAIADWVAKNIDKKERKASK